MSLDLLMWSQKILAAELYISSFIIHAITKVTCEGEHREMIFTHQ